MLPARVVLGFCMALTVLAATVCSAQDYPTRPIRIITASPGSGSDGVARLLAAGISTPLGQPVIVDNRPSALTGDFAMKAVPDGYTLLVEGNSFWIAPLIQQTPYDVMKDFSPITIVLLAPNVVVGHPGIAANTLSE